MAKKASVFKNAVLSVDGTGTIGKLDDLEIPTLKILTEDFRPGGSDGVSKQDVGIEISDLAFNLAEPVVNVLKNFGVMDRDGIPYVIRAHFSNGKGDDIPVQIKVSGLMIEVAHGTWKGGASAKTKYTVTPDTYLYTQSGAVVHDIRPLDNVRIIDGVDQKAAERKSLGL